ncbi:alpha/beta hydrolase [Aeromicrobium sp. CTD01-1L150]|uniref:alpha/beta hydrolase n=1 Tax=Aeromicrobium sp. CTD01-1L150 TaxID=3341830 RepID=UPI0035C26192
MFWTSLRRRVSSLVRRPVALRPRRVRVAVPGRRREFRVAHEDVVIHEESSLRAKALGRAARVVLKPVLRFAPLNDRTLATLRSIDRLSARGPRSRYVEPVAFELGGVPVESMTHRYGPSSAMTVLYLHGGGFFSCGIETHRRICERLALYTGGTVISVEYVQLPDGAVADSVADAINAYEALLEMVEDPGRIVVAGDSAGGYLTMKVAELAARRGLQPPAALLGFSPLLSLDPDVAKDSVRRVARVRDAYLPVRRVALVRERWTPAGSSIEGSESPLEAVDLIESPTFLVGVEDEMLRPEIEAMALLLSERGVEVETHLWRGQVHAFPVLVDALPESRQALKLAADFARRAVGESELHRDAGGPRHEEPIVGEIVDEPSTEDDDVIDVELQDTERDSRRRWFFQAG